MISEEFENNKKLYAYLCELISENKRQKIEKLAPKRSSFIVPVIEDIFQFRNAAAIVRSMEAFAFQKLYALEKNNIFNPEATVSRGADKWIDIEFLTAGLDALQKIKNEGYQLIAISPEKNAVNIQDFVLNKPTALIFGTEFNGVTKETLDFADDCIKIPMIGFTESLNVSVAAGITFYEMRNKIENSSLNWKLSEEETLQLKIKWAVNSVSSGSEIATHYLKSLQA